MATIEIPFSNNPIIHRFREYIADRPDSWEDYPSVLIDDMRHAIKAHEGVEVYTEGEDIGVDELYGALSEMFEDLGFEEFSRVEAEASVYFTTLAQVYPMGNSASTTTVDNNPAPRVRHDFITVFEVGQQMPTHVHRAHIVRFTPKADDAENSTYIYLTAGGLMHVHETSDEIFDMLGAGA